MIGNLISGFGHTDATLTRARMAVAAIFFFNGFGISNWVVRIPTVREALGLSDGGLGLVLLSTAVGSLLAMPFVGALVGRYGSRPVTTVLAWFCGLTLFLPGLATSPWWLAAFLVLLGAGNGGVDVAMNAHGTTVETRYGRPILSSFHALWSVGSLLGASTGAAFAGAGIAPNVHLSVIATVLLVGFTIASRFLLPANADQTHGTHDAPREPMRITAPLLALGAIGFLALLSEGSVADWGAVYLRDTLKSSEGFAGLGFAAFQTTMAIFRFAGDGLSQRFGATSLIRIGGGLCALGMAVALILAQPWAALIGFAISGAGISVLFPSALSLVSRVPGIQSGAGIAWVASVGYAGFLVGPPMIGGISDLSSLPVGLSTVILAGVLIVTLAGAVRSR